MNACIDFVKLLLNLKNKNAQSKTNFHKKVFWQATNSFSRYIINSNLHYRLVKKKAFFFETFQMSFLIYCIFTCIHCASRLPNPTSRAMHCNSCFTFRKLISKKNVDVFSVNRFPKKVFISPPPHSSSGSSYVTLGSHSLYKFALYFFALFDENKRVQRSPRQRRRENIHVELLPCFSAIFIFSLSLFVFLRSCLM